MFSVLSWFKTTLYSAQFSTSVGAVATKEPEKPLIPDASSTLEALPWLLTSESVTAELSPGTQAN